MSNMSRISKFLPIFDWGRTYNQVTFTNDLVAAVVVTVMLIPQSLAYALLAGLPPEMGLYASMFPIVLYAIFGTSRVLAVGPVAVVSLLTAAAVGKIAIPGTPEYIAAAITLAFMSGIILLGLGLFRLGFLANFLSHPVITGFVNAAAILIIVSQLPGLSGIALGDAESPKRKYHRVELDHLADRQSDNSLSTLGAQGISSTSFKAWY